MALLNLAGVLSSDAIWNFSEIFDELEKKTSLENEVFLYGRDTQYSLFYVEYDGVGKITYPWIFL